MFHPMVVLSVDEQDQPAKLSDGWDTDTEPWCHSHGTGGAYGRIVAHDAHSLTYSHVQNNGGNVSDTFTLTKK